MGHPVRIELTINSLKLADHYTTRGLYMRIGVQYMQVYSCEAERICTSICSIGSIYVSAFSAPSSSFLALPHLTLLLAGLLDCIQYPHRVDVYKCVYSNVKRIDKPISQADFNRQ